MPTPDLPKAYDPQAAQARWYPYWLERGYFHADPASGNPPYVIVIPPPNVTGALHLGHALNNTLQDILIRWRRMHGYDALWIPGTDHAGIATEAVVEKRIFQEEKKTRHDLGRDELVGRIRSWKNEYEARILKQLRMMGCSCDWQRTRFTFDEGFQRAVRRTFFNLFKAGKIFRGKRLVNWDTQLRTAVADDEIYTEDVAGHIWTIKYPVVGSDTGEVLHVATTRPETMLGDTAVAVHPDDERYKHLIGKSVDLPLTDRRIPIIADPILVDPAFGTGCVKVTPAHDPNDYLAGQRNGLPMINLLNPDGTFNENAGDKYKSLDRLVVRKRVLEDLKELGFLERVDSHLVPLKHSDRSKTPIEPYLSDQWFVRMGDNEDGSPGFAQMAMDAVTFGRVNIHPERYAKSYLDWLSEKRDWCISRQLWWGHRIPVWSKTASHAEALDLSHRLPHLESVDIGVVSQKVKPEYSGFVSSQLFADPESGTVTLLTCIDAGHANLESQLESVGMIQDPDVLDTWFSSALWPCGTLGWPDDTPELRKYHPTSVLSTARDIITLWVARMVIFAEFNVGQVPFKDVFIHPVIQDGDGKRMSKSAGNGIDPVDIIDTYGADALRFTLACSATETQDLRMPIEPVKNEQGLLAIRKAFGQPIEWVAADIWKKTPKDQRVNTSERFEIGRTFPNKFWNAARFAIMNLESFDPAAGWDADPAEPDDRWILERLRITTESVTACLERFQFADAAKTLRDFAWSDFCDSYLEFVKVRLRDESRRAGAQRCLVIVLDGLCRLLHPFVPFVTEEVWQALAQAAPQRWDPAVCGVAPAANSVSVASWPSFPPHWSWPDDYFTVTQWQEKTAALLNLRAESKVPEKTKIAPLFAAEGRVAEAIERGKEQIGLNTRSESITVVGLHYREPPHCGVKVLADARILLPLEGLIDLDAERARQEKELSDLRKQAAAQEVKLANPSFVERAPEAVVGAHRARLADLRSQIEQLDSLLKNL